MTRIRAAGHDDALPGTADPARSAPDRSGKWWPRVESCCEHADELIEVRRIWGPPTARG